MNTEKLKNAHPNEKYPEKTLIGALTDEWQSTSKIAKLIGCNPYTLRLRYHALAEAGRIDRVNVGGSYLWRIGK